jgi:hypothetical protein
VAQRLLGRFLAQGFVRDDLSRACAAVSADMEALMPHLRQRAESLAARTAEQLTARGEKEARQMAEILEGQRKRIEETAARYERPQLLLDFDDGERRQIDADRRHWRRRLDALQVEIRTEPERVRRTYDVRATRVEPVGLVYLWPVSG